VQRPHPDGDDGLPSLAEQHSCKHYIIAQCNRQHACICADPLLFASHTLSPLISCKPISAICTPDCMQQCRRGSTAATQAHQRTSNAGTIATQEPGPSGQCSSRKLHWQHGVTRRVRHIHCYTVIDLLQIHTKPWRGTGSYCSC
jgi:hypothetical protein